MEPQLTHCRDSLLHPEDEDEDEDARLPIRPREPSSEPKLGSSLKIGEIDPDGLDDSDEGGDEGETKFDFSG